MYPYSLAKIGIINQNNQIVRYEIYLNLLSKNKKKKKIGKKLDDIRVEKRNNSAA